MLPGALVMLVAGPLSGVLGSRFGGKVPLALGAIITAAGLLLMALDPRHPGRDGRLELVMSIGIGLAFAAMPNLILEAVPQRRPARRPASTRSCARSAPRSARRSRPAILAGSVVAGAVLPTDGGYTDAFLVSAGVADRGRRSWRSLIPRAAVHATRAAIDEIGAAAPLGDPALVVEQRR